MNNTPETDAAWEYLCSNFSRHLLAEKMKTYCPEKERERNEAREQIAKLRDIAERAIDECWFWSDKAKNIQADWDKLNEEGAK